MTRLLVHIIKIYTEYAVAYSNYIDVYNVYKDEGKALKQIEECDRVYQNLNTLISTFSDSEEMTYDLMNILSVTDADTHKIDMANNLQEFFEYIG
jgi:hypothetical protein